MVAASNCGTTSSIYPTSSGEKIYSGQLTEAVYSSLTQFLKTQSNAELNDTIIIKYDYNGETCWDMLDRQKDSYIMGIVSRTQERVRQVLQSRDDVSVYCFREPGNRLNKIKKWDSTILIDNKKQLYDLLFKKRSNCGNSIIVMSDRRFVFLRSDSHFTALDMRQTQIIDVLNRL
jgi:hypothetical protein